MRTGTDALRSMHRYIWKLLEFDMPPLWQDAQSAWEIRYWGEEGTFRFPFARVAAITPVNYSGRAVERVAQRTLAVHLYPVPQETPELSLMEAERVEELLFVAFETGFTFYDPVSDPNPPVLGAQGVGALDAATYQWAVSVLGLQSGESAAAYTPISVTFAAPGGSQALSWDPSPGAQSYNVYRSVDGGTFDLIASVVGLGFVDDGTQPPFPQHPQPVGNAVGVPVQSKSRRVPLYDYDGVPLDGPFAVSNTRAPSDYLRVMACPINRIVDPEDDRFWLVTAEPQVQWRRTGTMPKDGPVVQSVRVAEDFSLDVSAGS